MDEMTNNAQNNFSRLQRTLKTVKGGITDIINQKILIMQFVLNHKIDKNDDWIMIEV